MYIDGLYHRVTGNVHAVGGVEDGDRSENGLQARVVTDALKRWISVAIGKVQLGIEGGPLIVAVEKGLGDGVVDRGSAPLAEKLDHGAADFAEVGVRVVNAGDVGEVEAYGWLVGAVVNCGKP